MHLKSAHAKQHANPGFSLVVTVSMLILLTVIAVGLLTLSSVSIKSAGISAAESRARANARMALMMALDQLQTQLGPDQRVSANADILSASSSVANPHWMGVWDSWIAGAPGTARVNSNYPSALNSTHQTIGALSDPLLRPTYSQKNRHFRGWLLSMSPEDVTNIYAAVNPSFEGVRMPGETDNAVVLVGEGSLGLGSSDTDEVSAKLIEIEPNENSDKNRGRFAWWVGDESQKATIMEDSYAKEASLTIAQRLFRQEAPGSMGNTSITGLDQMTDETQLASLASKKSIELVTNVGTTKAQPRYHDITTLSMGVLADVREGGLKRDLSTLLERNIDPNEMFNFTYVEEFLRPTSYKPGADAFKLYEFDSLRTASANQTGMACVPIQDLAAYYQLYDNKRSGWKGGIQFSSSESSPPNSYLTNGIQVSSPNLGSTPSDAEKFLREYTGPYRNPLLVKVEVVLHYITEERTAAEIAADPLTLDGDPNTIPDTHKLKIGLTPAMTFWNPFNVPLIMHISSNPQISSVFMREHPIPVSFTFYKSGSSTGPRVQQGAAINLNQVSNVNQAELYTFYVSGTQPMIFEPGESKVVSLGFTSSSGAGNSSVDFLNRGANVNEDFRPELQLIPGWNPEKFVRTTNTTMGRSRQGRFDVMTFNSSDYISVDVNGGTSGFSFDTISTARQRRNSTPAWYHHRQFSFRSRLNGSTTYGSNFSHMGFPRAGRGSIVSTTPRTISIPSRQGSNLITAMGNPTDFNDDLPQTFFYYSWKAASETHETNNISPPGGGSARRLPARPFLHSPAHYSAFFDNIDGASLYNIGWNWFFMPLNNMLDSPISISSRNFGYFGGGYTAESGTTHVVQQQLPLTPCISIAALSHARLGGYSMATEPAAAGWSGLTNPTTSEYYQRTTANGLFGGLGPCAAQAIGNSYAHPNIPAGKAFITTNRMFVEGVNTPTPFADHSYLANKALWDEFFFSSITPVPDNPIFGSTPKTVNDVAKDFFFNDQALPNRRIMPYGKNLDEAKLDYMLSQYTDFSNGFADKIASHLMVNGAFNVNSTSVEAWKALFSSMKGKPVAYLDKDSALTGGVVLKEDAPTGTPIAAGGVPNAKAFSGSSNDPSDEDQWVGWRELTDQEIEELAKAMVRQVKKRGPFLSMSEFVNRRLDSSDAELSSKGALQAAIDDPAIPTAQAINGGFRSADRKFTAAEKSFVNAQFREALEGAVAYGSAAYVDQADILRNLAEQLTPRGDTFVIRAYGDSLDKNGKVEARAWCEAVIQRTPEYVDSSSTGDTPETKQANLNSTTNRIFGRKMEIISFRWLNSSEI